MKNFNKLVKTIAVSTLGLGIATGTISEAQAVSLVPTQEGEIETNLGCLDDDQCIDTTKLEFGYKVESLKYDDNFDLSRLFVDDRTTENTYGIGIDSITFGDEDGGTNPEFGKFWLRPAAYQDGKAVEGGNLEVGSFKFDFLGKTANEVRLSFFDVEDSDITGIIEQVNGNSTNTDDFLLEGGEDGNIQTLVLKDVKSFVVQLGNVNSSKFNTGDGVNLKVSVPESQTSIGLSVLGVAGMLTLKRRKTASQKLKSN